LSKVEPNGYRYRLGVDIGGTFTDVVLLDTEAQRTYVGKVLTTPDSPADAVIEGLRKILSEHKAPPEAIDNPIHGTTLVTNAIIERNGAKTALITTKGFRDAVEIGTEKRYDLFDLFMEKPEPLAPRALRFEVTERLDPDGNVLTPLDEAEAKDVIGGLRNMGVEAIAVTLLHSFLNPAHERRIEALIREQDPAILTSISSEVSPEIREHPRTSTTLANAYVRPLMRTYLELLSRRIRDEGIRTELYIMLSNGGIATVETAESFPIRLIESGPAAGAMAAAHIGNQLALKDLISFDMGGTTAKTCFIENGRPTTVTEFEVARVYQFRKGSGLPVKVPVIDMIEIGAGGGSIARVDDLGLLKVGPQSAGANPGPACYGQGGDRPTVTDADLLLGYMNPDFFLGGEMNLDVDAARSAMDRLARTLGLEGLQTQREHGQRRADPRHRERQGRPKVRPDGLRRGRPDPRGPRRRKTAARRPHQPARRGNALGARDAHRPHFVRFRPDEDHEARCPGPGRAERDLRRDAGRGAGPARALERPGRRDEFPPLRRHAVRGPGV